MLHIVNDLSLIFIFPITRDQSRNNMQYMSGSREGQLVWQKMICVGNHGFVRLEIEPSSRTDHNTDQVILNKLTSSNSGVAINCFNKKFYLKRKFCRLV